MKILITGSNSDISKAMGKLLQKDNNEIYFGASSSQKIEESKSWWEKEGDQAHKNKIHFCLTPFNNSQELKNTIDKIKPQALVLNAWKKVEELKYFHEFNEEEVTTELDENIKANLLMLKYALPHMKLENLGRIIFVSSIAAVSGSSKYGLYCMGKAAIEAMMQNIAVDYGKFNITANTLRLGLIKTERTRRFWSRENYEKIMAKGIPMGRLGEADEIADAVSLLLRNKTYINGATLNISGGLPLISSSGAIRSKPD